MAEVPVLADYNRVKGNISDFAQAAQDPKKSDTKWSQELDSLLLKTQYQQVQQLFVRYTQYGGVDSANVMTHGQFRKFVTDAGLA